MADTPKKRGRPKGIPQPKKPPKPQKATPQKLERLRYAERSTDLTLEVARTICHYLRMGSWLDVAANAAGVKYQTVRSWIRQGRAALDAKALGEEVPLHQQIYMEFLLAINDAASKAELIDLKRINAAGRAGDWRAVAWKMEHRYKNWRPKQKIHHEHSGKAGAPPIAHAHALVEIDVDALPIEVCEQILDALNAQKALPAPETQKGDDDGETTAE